ncbi:hypothetical protein BDP81DRAFT_477063 [Colletotrichum phormii]|uniref:Protein kinase domain-containing protein n=1 Tax=Colletotrichum phormii TaxID=359342 RepID=A0AAJ0E888_9PEZI|nr:uncharacterized protein BDP81DRAFT_477063 [Colletotrichum phormii]KAK1613510.1 hypothetical protein BDP81DRAFT_477063 [Colletotrichum phormii]
MKGRSWSPVGARRRGLKSFTARMTLRLFAIASIVVIYHLLDLHFRYREYMRIKYLPTQFDSLSDYDEAVLTSTGWEVDSHTTNAERSILLDNRRHWKKLGRGREGETFAFNNTVIKVYNEETSPFRNCIQGSDAPPRRWPTEIPASLIMGGHDDGSTLFDDEQYREYFVPVKDYFLATTEPLGSPRWHLVSPFLNSGTLKHLAKKLRTSNNRHSYRELDQMFRPSFESLLSALDSLHMAHDLCHDDVKLDNIFVASEHDPRKWKFGDLGNAREPDHPYHYTPLWISDTPQLRDCRANDALRLTRVYLQFLRASSGDPDAFDEALIGGIDTLSRFYWVVARSPIQASAAQIWQLSAVYPPQLVGEKTPWMTMQPAQIDFSRGWAPTAEAVFGWKGSLRSAVKKELRIGAKENMGRLFGLTRILGIPVEACQAV